MYSSTEHDLLSKCMQRINKSVIFGIKLDFDMESDTGLMVKERDIIFIH